jgi:hypothetical protein
LLQTTASGTLAGMVTAPSTALDKFRDSIRTATRDLLSVLDSALEMSWSWIGGSEVELRYGFYRVLEALEAAEADLALSGIGPPDQAAAVIAPATAARWDLQGVLASLDDEILDRAPGEEWSIRQTMGHVIEVQRAYAVFSAWWRTQGYAVDSPDLPPRAPDSVGDGLPSEEEEARGTLAELRARLDAVVDFAADLLVDITPGELELGARWSGFAVPIAFRIGRWSSHLQEHTVQLDKTLVLLGRQPTEAARLVRLVNRAYGRLEMRVFPGPAGEDALAMVAAAAADGRRIAAEIREVAGRA